MSVDMLAAIKPKSHQLNADSLWGGPKTIRIRDVTEGISADQPVALYYDGDEGLPYLPSKGMRRVIVAVWGIQTKDYIGRSMTIFRDPKVLFGGVETGGIRISHMSHITSDQKIAVAMNKTSRKPVIIKPLILPKEQPEQSPAPLQLPAPPPVKRKSVTEWLDELERDLNDATAAMVDDILARTDVQQSRDRLTGNARERLSTMLDKAVARTAAANAEDESEPEPTTNEEAA